MLHHRREARKRDTLSCDSLKTFTVTVLHLVETAVTAPCAVPKFSYQALYLKRYLLPGEGVLSPRSLRVLFSRSWQTGGGAWQPRAPTIIVNK